MLRRDGSARLQFELAQQPNCDHLPSDISKGLLQTALMNHKIALEYDQEHSDILFNTGQILSIAAEEARSNDNDLQALKSYREALFYLERCLEQQDKEFKDLQQLAPASNASELNASNDEPLGAINERQEIWTSVVETVSPETLYDTLLEIENILSDVCTLRCQFEEEMLAWVKNTHENVILERFLKYAKQSRREDEATRKIAWFRFTFCDNAFRNGYISVSDFETESARAFRDITNNYDSQPSTPSILVKLDAQARMSQSLQRKILTSFSLGPGENEGLLDLQKNAWVHLSQALDLLSLTCEAHLAQEQSSAVIASYLRRGDCELARRWLGTIQPCSVATSNATMLSRNAKIYYKGAREFAKRWNDEQSREEATIKGAVANYLAQEVDEVFAREIAAIEAPTVEETVGEMIEEMLIVGADIADFGWSLDGLGMADQTQK